MKLRSSDTPLILSGRSPFDEAASAFRRGGVIAFPTETFYGLGFDPFNVTPLRNFCLKGREQGKPVLLIIKTPQCSRPWHRMCRKRHLS